METGKLQDGLAGRCCHVSYPETAGDESSKASKAREGKEEWGVQELHQLNFLPMRFLLIGLLPCRSPPPPTTAEAAPCPPGSRR